ncbi:TldD/PmbA family protein [Gabonibacter chumensis]|uniref:TldD/PmbA family protein n=1 Tax=Gabonibacter chumensis TaxID=2972474 RepID=UPI0025740E72|nr:metallopeptidase TldD-related protein [Gabonibacter chumensis]MCR9011883.1 metallopeptidase TldD-related protein [Gabonibacter chumensis]
MRKCRLVILSLFLFLLFLPGAFGQEQDKLLQLLKQELAYDMKELQKQEFPPYHMNFRVLDDRNVNISSSFGATMSVQDYRTRMLVPQIRLGDTLLDNFKYNYMGTAPDQRRNYRGSLLPLEDENGEDGIRQAIWSEVIKRYNFALDMYEKAKTQSTVSVDNEDKAPCFSSTPVEKYYEAPIPAEKQAIDVKAWEKRLNEVSSIFKESSLLQEGQASLSFRVLRTYFVNTEGTEVVQNRTYARIIISASMKAEDGMDLPLNLSYFAYELKDLPSNERLIADAKDMVKRLSILRTAPVVDPYTGPAILSGPASGVFFHEIFGHRLEGHRMKSGGQTFKKMVGEQVLPVDFQVYSDPTLRQYAGDYMNGFYLYDDEGVKARRVDVVTNGVLKEFLMSRVPLEGFPHSNAHGRTAGGGDPVSRQANLVVETTNPRTEAQLRQMLIEEAKKQGKEYGYYFKEVTSGFTYTGEGGSLNSFNVTPLEVYRVYVDGRPDELVRGVDLIGTPLSMFSNIVAGGDQPSVFTGMCGAESGWVPVTASSPMIFVNKIETQRREKSRQLPPILQAPSENKK